MTHRAPRADAQYNKTWEELTTAGTKHCCEQIIT